MTALLWLFLAIQASPFKSKCQLEVDNVALRHQLVVLRRHVRGRVRLTNLDRLVLVQPYRWFPSILKVLAIVSAGDGHSLASCRLSQLLALEITIAGRAAGHCG
jgi:hypothetical protein